MKRQKILDLLKNNKKYIQDKFNINSIALFGSVAKNSANENSDIDILVDMKPSYKNYYLSKQYFENIFDKPVDLITKNSLRSFIKEEINKDLIYV
jgi:predicted nucleotidyltransferase